jgi:ABC-type branched-subunit amino acid transport system substrate-binding protein
MLSSANRLRSFGAALAALASLVACVPAKQTTPTAPPQQTARPEPEAPRLAAGPPSAGLLMPLSGVAEDVGRDMLDAAQMALFDVGANTLVLMPRDTTGDPQVAAATARAVISEGADIILGPLFANSTRSVGPAAAASGVNILSFSNDSSVAGGNVFILGFRPEEQIERITQFANQRGLTRIGLLAPDDAYGTLAAQAFSAAMAELGPAAESRTAFYRPDGDPSAAVAALDSGGMPLDAVLIADGGPRLVQVAGMIEARSQGRLPPRLLGTGRWQEDPSVLQNPSLAGGWFADVAPSARAAFDQRFRSVYGRQPHAVAALAYDATALAVLLASSDQAFDARAITDPQGFVGTLSIFRVHENGTTEHGLAILEAGPGGPLVIQPAPQSFVGGVPAF